jgi:hypothetical protein
MKLDEEAPKAGRRSFERFNSHEVLYEPYVYMNETSITYRLTSISDGLFAFVLI